MRILGKVSFFIFFLYTQLLSAQTPGFNYQALILNSSEIEIPGSDVEKNKVPLALEEVTFQFTITNAAGVEYIEEHTVFTDENGMVSLIVGEGKPIAATFNDINWDGKLKYLNVEVDILSNSEGFVFLDTQKILYIPHPTKGGNSNVTIVQDLNNLFPPYTKGDLIWNQNYGTNGNPTLMIWDGAAWQPVSQDYDPTNELGLVVVSDESARSARFPNPVTGDQVWNTACNCLEVFNGTEWVSVTASSSNTEASNGLYKQGNTIKLGGVLTQPTSIITNSTNTLAIKDLEESISEDVDIVVAEKVSGVLRKMKTSSLLQQEQIVITATDGQVLFNTPKPISSNGKIDVFRNGVRIEFTTVNSNTIEVEPEAICYQNDKIRIVQLY